MESLIATLLVPIMLLNSIGGVVAGIWLIVIGKWTLVVSALISTVISTWVLALLLAPTLIFAKPFAWATERKKNALVLILGALSNLWTFVLMLLYSLGSFVFIFNNYESGTTVPYLLLAYAVSTGPWTYMAKGEHQSGGGGAGTTIPVIGVCVASVAMMVTAIFYGVLNVVALTVACVIPLTLAWVLQMIFLVSTLKENSKTP